MGDGQGHHPGPADRLRGQDIPLSAVQHSVGLHVPDAEDRGLPICFKAFLRLWKVFLQLLPGPRSGSEIHQLLSDRLSRPHRARRYAEAGRRGGVQAADRHEHRLHQAGHRASRRSASRCAMACCSSTTQPVPKKRIEDYTELADGGDGPAVSQYRGNAAQWRDVTGCSTPIPTAVPTIPKSMWFPRDTTS